MHICNDPQTLNTLRVLIGTELKIAIGCDDTDLTACDFSVDIFTRQDKRITLAKSDLQLITGTHRYLAVVDTAQLGTGGAINVVLTAHIPDPDCPDGFRTEVARCLVGGVAQISQPWGL